MTKIYILIPKQKVRILRYWGNPTLQQVIRKIGGIRKPYYYCALIKKVGFGINDKLLNGEAIVFSRASGEVREGSWKAYWERNGLLKSQLKVHCAEKFV